MVYGEDLDARLKPLCEAGNGRSRRVLGVYDYLMAALLQRLGHIQVHRAPDTGGDNADFHPRTAYVATPKLRIHSASTSSGHRRLPWLALPDTCSPT